MSDNQKKQYPQCRNPEREKKEKGTEGIVKAIITEHFPNLGRKMDTPNHETQRPK